MTSAVAQLGDTTYTKVFVGGLPWETQKETMNNYFCQFGEILEAVIITDKNTGRSKGYGFVTFREADAAMRACVDANPVIDGRRANCNLASLGAQRSKPSTPNSKNNIDGGVRNKRMRTIGGFSANSSSFSHNYNNSIRQGIPTYNLLYGYYPYPTECAYPASYYGAYGGTSGVQCTLYGPGGGAYYPYNNINFSEGSGGATGYGSIQYPHHIFQYSTINSAVALYPHQYGTPFSLSPPSPLQSGVNHDSALLKDSHKMIDIDSVPFSTKACLAAHLA